MQTNFSIEQRNAPDTGQSEKIIRTCVHCGFCTATCPTYLLLGDERDSPRGRIYLIKEMLEKGGKPAPDTVKHIDRCLSCLSCVTTCPSGVDYMHLVDHARAYIEEHHARPLPDRLMRSMLAFLLPRPALFRLALLGAAIARPFKALMPGRLKGMLDMAPARLPANDGSARPQVFAASGPRKGRVAILSGCAQPVIAPHINTTAIRLLNRLGLEVVIARQAGCCGALPHHLGKTDASHHMAQANIAAWSAEIDTGGLDAIVITTSGCGTTIKDYGHMFRDDPVWAERAARVSALARDITELVTEADVRARTTRTGLKVAYHSACSLQHGQKIRDQPRALLQAAGFQVMQPREAHICCGSAGTYNLLQPRIASQLGQRKADALDTLKPDVVAAGNIGCITQIAAYAETPILHTVELLDWATGGPAHPVLDAISIDRT